MATMWKEDAALVAARKHPEWCNFHRRAGDQEVFFTVEAVQGKGYRTEVVRFERRSERFGDLRTIDIVTEHADQPIQSLVAAFNTARSSGDPVAELLDPGLGQLFGPPQVAADPIAELIG